MHMSTIIIFCISNYEEVMKKSHTLKINWLHHTHHLSKATTVTFSLTQVSLVSIYRFSCQNSNGFAI